MCNGCESVYYCSTDHQRKDYKRGHKNACKKIGTGVEKKKEDDRVTNSNPYSNEDHKEIADGGETTTKEGYDNKN